METRMLQTFLSSQSMFSEQSSSAFISIQDVFSTLILIFMAIFILFALENILEDMKKKRKIRNKPWETTYYL